MAIEPTSEIPSLAKGLSWKLNCLVPQQLESGVQNAVGIRSLLRESVLRLDQSDVQRLVIDMRNNTGGDNTLLRPLLIAMIRSKLNRRGGIYVITSSTTFSAAQNFVNRLQIYTEAIFVGEPTAENVNFYGDPAGFTLPHSQLEAAVSQLWWQDNDPRDKRVATAPEIAAEGILHDYATGLDPVLQLALTMSTLPTLEEFLEGSLPTGLEATQARYEVYVNDPAHKYAEDLERQLNTLGYKLLGARRVQDAIIIFEVNARSHPGSSNAYDSHGEGYANAKESSTPSPPIAVRLSSIPATRMQSECSN